MYKFTILLQLKALKWFRSAPKCNECRLLILISTIHNIVAVPSVKAFVFVKRCQFPPRHNCKSISDDIERLDTLLVRRERHILI